MISFSKWSPSSLPAELRRYHYWKLQNVQGGMDFFERFSPKTYNETQPIAEVTQKKYKLTPVKRYKQHPGRLNTQRSKPTVRNKQA